ncbi:protein-L-isoaspartate O-methyltransferase [Helicobacter sp.]|uniref:protein-L-isoaspartate O-methyltransferase n=1 Tax=Helicobacter sp. TaxID=218 RepID=UPI0025BF415B|nr:protein-L-isoaspartate O-methyltransferase [Helicobacter sp.]MBR2494896.1 protein-L-isoaspartate O-methyltransferase [Helicobacter sp.]
MHKIKGRLMCDEIAKHFSLQDKIRNALESVNREMFVPNFSKHLAYSLDPLPMQAAQWVSSPLTVAKMTQYLTPGDSVLEIGCGSGYQAMVLAQIFRRVFSIERIEPLLTEARKRIRATGVGNIHTKFGDGQQGWAEYAPYDRILFSACIEKEIPQAIIDQLEEGGILVAPIQEVITTQNILSLSGTKTTKKQVKQYITRFTKHNGTLNNKEVLEECLFVPVLDGTTH